MKRFLIVPVLVPVLLVALVRAGDSSDPDDSDRLHRNRHLVQVLVTSGLSLAQEEDALRRADFCNALASSVVREIHQAAELQDSSRAVELSEHLQALLKRGVASNLTSVRLVTPPGSTRELEMRRVSQQMKELTGPLERLLKGAVPADLEDLGRILTGLHEAQSEVETVLKSAPKPEP
jgi:hypothetical protein